MGSGALGKGGRWQEGWVWICLGECGACLVLFGACVWGMPVGVLVWRGSAKEFAFH
ncbi:hypothetical protein [Bartonella sp. AP58NXGY]|uniref:hypothetical protein n=1 Tax=Bartonella sp. AP58NXGY TaxID=3243498 RepID=UPI0035CF7F3C